MSHEEHAKLNETASEALNTKLKNAIVVNEQQIASHPGSVVRQTDRAEEASNAPSNPSPQSIPTRPRGIGFPFSEHLCGAGPFRSTKNYPRMRLTSYWVGSVGRIMTGSYSKTQRLSPPSQRTRGLGTGSIAN